MPNTSKPPSPPRPHLVRASDRAGVPAATFSHPLNPRSSVRWLQLGDAVGLARVGVNLIHVPPKKESLAYHSHYSEEEFIYVLSGRGVAEVGDEEFEIGPGDFMGFPTPSVAHHIRNPFEEELVYLSGGERRSAEIADFPRLKKRMVRVGDSVSIHRIDDDEAFLDAPRVRSR